MCVKSNEKYYTHLAVNFGRDDEIGHGKNYDHEAGQARKGVDLSEGHIQTRILKLRHYHHVPI